jgi:hypothetical protein
MLLLLVEDRGAALSIFQSSFSAKTDTEMSLASSIRPALDLWQTPDVAL